MTYNEKPLIQILILITVAVLLWPLVVPSTWLAWKRRAIGRKIAFWFASVAAGYLLMFGIPALGVYLLVNFGRDLAMRAGEPYVTFYWSGFAVIAVLIVLIPVGSTWFLYSKFSAGSAGRLGGA